VLLEVGEGEDEMWCGMVWYGMVWYGMKNKDDMSDNIQPYEPQVCTIAKHSFHSCENPAFHSIHSSYVHAVIAARRLTRLHLGRWETHTHTHKN